MSRRDNGYNAKDFADTRRKKKRKHANNGGSVKDKAQNIVETTLTAEAARQRTARADFAADAEAGRATRREADGSWWVTP